jgi:hypothetical protein
MRLRRSKFDYIDDVGKHSEFPGTIDAGKSLSDIYGKFSPGENAQMRAEYDSHRDDLRSGWEAENGKEWPRYKEDV